MRKTVFVIIFILFTLTVSACFKTNEATIRPTEFVQLYELSEDIYGITWSGNTQEDLCTFTFLINEDFVIEARYDEYANEAYEILSDIDNYKSSFRLFETCDFRIVFQIENYQGDSYEIVYERLFTR